MKKKILLVLTFIISFILYTNNVEAASELTCVYQEGKGQKAVKIVQYADGTKKVYVNMKEKTPNTDSEYWYSASYVSFNSEEELTFCPKYMDYAGGANRTVIFSSTVKNGYAELIHEQSGIDDKHNSVKDEDYVSGEKSNMANELASGKWLIGCQYKKLNTDDKYVYLYFNETKVRFVEGEDVLPIYTKEKDSIVSPYDKYSDIPVSRVIKEYNSNGGCPINIYRNELTGTANDGKVVYSLDKLTSSSKMSTYIYVKGPDSKPEPTPSNPKSGCELLGEDVVDFINQIMKWIRIFVPILLIGLGILDFTKATFSKSEDDMKKSREKFIKRIVAAVLVFLAPIFVNLILELANSVWSWIGPETCVK